MKRIAIIGAGLSGLTAAWQLTRPNVHDPVAVTLFEASARAGGIIETVRDSGFVLELGPDSWVTEKSAARELMTELGLAHELISSNDATRKTHLLLNGRLETMPDGLRMMVPIGREALSNVDRSPLFSASARQAFHDELARAQELQRSAPLEDESIASFTDRHFGREVLDRIAVPLLSGVFGGDVHTLSVRAIMAPFVAMERQHGSLIAALGEREAERVATGRPVQPIFTTLRSGLGTLADTLAAQLPPTTLQLKTRVLSLRRADPIHHRGWILRTHRAQPAIASTPSHTAADLRDDLRADLRDDLPFDDVILATPAHVTAALLHPIDPAVAALLPTEASSAILVAFAWKTARFTLPQGFGFLVPPPTAGIPAASRLLAATFADQKFPGRASAAGRVIRAFFGGAEAGDLLARNVSDDALRDLALAELRAILGPLPEPDIAGVRRWPLSLPQYRVGHLERLAALDRSLAAIPGLHLLGNALRGVGLPDLIREARRLARDLAPTPSLPVP